MSEKATLTVWIVVDADGDFDCGNDRDSAVENFENSIGNAVGCRAFPVKVQVTLPQHSDEAEKAAPTANIPDEAGDTVTVG